MTNITDDGTGHTTETTLVDSHDRGSSDYNRRKGEANSATPEPKRKRGRKAADTETKEG